jgi:hypothetical protein
LAKCALHRKKDDEKLELFVFRLKSAPFHSPLFKALTEDKDIIKEDSARDWGVHILTKQYFPRAHTEERKELETSLVTVGANSSVVVRGERG